MAVVELLQTDNVHHLQVLFDQHLCQKLVLGHTGCTFIALTSCCF